MALVGLSGGYASSSANGSASVPDITARISLIIAGLFSFLPGRILGSLAFG